MPLGKKGNAQQDFDELKRKYLTVDRNYEALKTLTRNGKERVHVDRSSFINFIKPV